MTGVLVATGDCMGALAIFVVWKSRRWRSAWLGELGRGALAGLLVQLAAEAVLSPVYTFTMRAQRLALCAAFLVIALPAFSAICAAATWPPDGQIVRGVHVEFLLAAITGALATQWFVRMSALPVILLAGTLAFAAAYRAGGRGTLAAAAFAAVIYSRAVSDVCAFY